MELRTHIYDCKKLSQNQIPAWMRMQKEKPEEHCALPVFSIMIFIQ